MGRANIRPPSVPRSKLLACHARLALIPSSWLLPHWRRADSVGPAPIRPYSERPPIQRAQTVQLAPTRPKLKRPPIQCAQTVPWASSPACWGHIHGLFASRARRARTRFSPARVPNYIASCAMQVSTQMSRAPMHLLIAMTVRQALTRSVPARPAM